MRLQGIYTELPEKAVKDLKVNDVITWNYGYKSQVVNLTPSKTGKTYNVSLKSLQDGIIRDRKMKATRVVAVQ